METAPATQPTPLQLKQAAKRLGWEHPITPSLEALDTIAARLPAPRTDQEAAHRYRLAQAEEMLLRFRAQEDGSESPVMAAAAAS